MQRLQKGRSREGAWIEITVSIDDVPNPQRRSREGAWIEINRIDVNVIPQIEIGFCRP